MKHRINTFKQRLHAMKPRLLIVQLIITLSYPIAKAAISEYNRLLIFTDSLTIIAAVLLIAGVLYSLYLHGDFDITSFLFRRGVQRGQARRQSFETFKANRREERENSFNYPLFLGLVYIIVALVLAYGFV